MMSDMKNKCADMSPDFLLSSPYLNSGQLVFLLQNALFGGLKNPHGC